MSTNPEPAPNDSPAFLAELDDLVGRYPEAASRYSVLSTEHIRGLRRASSPGTLRVEGGSVVLDFDDASSAFGKPVCQVWGWDTDEDGHLVRVCLAYFYDAAGRPT